MRSRRGFRRRRRGCLGLVAGGLRLEQAHLGVIAGGAPLGLVSEDLLLEASQLQREGLELIHQRSVLVSKDLVLGGERLDVHTTN
jgi:hypothetical protein